MTHYVVARPAQPFGAAFSVEGAKERAIKRGEEKEKMQEASQAEFDARREAKAAKDAMLKTAVVAVAVLGALIYASSRRSRA